MNAFRTVLFPAALIAASSLAAFAQNSAGERNSGGLQGGGGMGDYMSKHSGSDSRSKDPGTTGTTTNQNGDAANNKTSGKNCTQKGGDKAQGHGEKC
jgi:hypothetical protein